MQNAMARGQALAAGWEFWLMIGISGSVSRPHLISTRSVTGFADDREGASNTLCCYTRGCLNVVVSMTKAALLYPTTHEGPNHWTPRSAVNARDIKHDLPTLNAAQIPCANEPAYLPSTLLCPIIAICFPLDSYSSPRLAFILRKITESIHASPTLE